MAMQGVLGVLSSCVLSRMEVLLKEVKNIEDDVDSLTPRMAESTSVCVCMCVCKCVCVCRVCLSILSLTLTIGTSIRKTLEG